MSVLEEKKMEERNSWGVGDNGIRKFNTCRNLDPKREKISLFYVKSFMLFETTNSVTFLPRVTIQQLTFSNFGTEYLLSVTYVHSYHFVQ